MGKHTVGGGPRFEIAHRLVRKSVPIVFLTGYESELLSDDLKSVRLLKKPVKDDHLVQTLKLLCEMGPTPETSFVS